MPIFEYACPGCGNHFDRYVVMSDSETKVCPKCQHEVSRVEFSVPAKRNPQNGIQR